ncbi:hypothetical protein LCGC14_2978630 [marine sediment metagenome]|uniref:Uncharacterized protein n=1 Tax=marine sediment metagenome TaxID=412755 RepID=A0A0F8ZYD1_9ZZZZ
MALGPYGKVDLERYTKALAFIEVRRKESYGRMVDAVKIVKDSAIKIDVDDPETVLEFVEVSLRWMAQLMNGAAIALNIDDLRRIVESVVVP